MAKKAPFPLVIACILTTAACAEDRRALPFAPPGNGGPGGQSVGVGSGGSGIVGWQDAAPTGDPSGGCQGGTTSEGGMPADGGDASAFDAENAEASDGGTLEALLDCVRAIDSTHYEALFGYQNDGARRRIPIGFGNWFSPGDEGRGQPEVFLPGRMPGVFAVRFDGTPLIWTLAGQAVTASDLPTTTPRVRGGPKRAGGEVHSDAGVLVAGNDVRHASQRPLPSDS